MKPVVKWSGSKRSQASEIVSYFPNNYKVYYEPFIGGGSIAFTVNPQHAICGDICEPLINLWNNIKTNPLLLAEEYKIRWELLQKNGSDVYYDIRRQFNESHKPEDFLFLSRTCTNGLIRFNSNGQFNNSFHITRSGIKPETLKAIIAEWSNRFKNVLFVCGDYRKTTEDISKDDFVYLDPPYFHTKGIYYGRIDYDEFFDYLERLNHIGVKYALSFDGIRGNQSKMVSVPDELYKRHILIYSGNSSFNRVMNKRKVEVYESLYLNY